MLTHEFPPFRGGVATYCTELASAAAALGHDVTVMAPYYPEHDTNFDASLPFAVVRFCFKSHHTVRMLYLLWLCFKIDTKKYDIVHAADWMFIVALHALQPIKKIPFVATVHGTDIHIMDNLNLVTRLRGKKFIKHAVRIVCNSRHTKCLAMKYHSYCLTNRIVVTHLGVTPFWFEEAGDVGALYKKFGVPEGRKVILSVSRLDPRKGHSCALQALAHLPQNEKDQLVYVIVGAAKNDEHQLSLHGLATRCGVPVIFTGKVPNADVRGLYSASWIFCLPGQLDPKKVEGFGLVYLEAAAQRLPSIATAIGGVPEVILDGKTGWLLKDAQPETLAKRISELLSQTQHVKDLGASAQEWAQEFSWKRCAEQTYGDIG